MTKSITYSKAYMWKVMHGKCRHFVFLIYPFAPCVQGKVVAKFFYK